ncbi:GNAT family N-acetyltransferase [Streptomyces sp. NPDC004376]
MPELQRLHARHAPAVLHFERVNREYFAASVSDRGDAFFERFGERFAALLAEQAAGICAFFVWAGADEAVLGRFNLVDVRNGTADLGYRVARHVAGRGVATEAVAELCRTQVPRLGLHTLRAAASDGNVASQMVLIKNGFVPVGPAGPEDLGGKSGTWFERHTLASGCLQ